MIAAIRGDSFSLPITVRESGAAFDLTGWTVAAQLRKVSRTAERGALIETFAVTVATPATGEIVISATAEQTALWPVGQAEFDVQMTRTVDGFVRSSAKVSVLIQGDVTDD